jgi:hypothetical protein
VMGAGVVESEGGDRRGGGKGRMTTESDGGG